MRFGIFLDQMKKSFGDEPREFNLFTKYYLHLRTPSWLRKNDANYSNYTLLALYQYQDTLYKKGKIVWGRVLKASQHLFKKGKKDDYAIIAYSLDPKINDNPITLISLTYSLSDKNLDSSNTKFKISTINPWGKIETPTKEEIPIELTDGIQFYYGSTMIIRKHLPKKYLESFLVPLLICPELTDYFIILPSKYWPQDFKQFWLNKSQANAINDQGIELFRQNSLVESIPYFEKAIELYPIISTYYTNLGLANLELNNNEKASSNFKLSLELNPTDQITMYHLAISHFEQENYESAQDYFSSLIKSNYSNLNVFYYNILALLNLKKYSDIIEEVPLYLPKFETLRKDKARLYNYWGIAHLRLSQFEQALEKFKFSLDLDPDDDLYYENMGFTFKKLEKFEDSVSYYKKCLELNPENSIAINSYSEILFRLDRASELIQFCKKTHNNHPSQWFIFLPWINALYVLQDFQKMATICETAIKGKFKIDSKNKAIIHNYYGLALSSLFDFEKAIEQFELAIALDPELTLAYENLGDILFELNRDQKSTQKFLTALEIQKQLKNNSEVINIYLHWIRILQSRNLYDEVKEKAEVILQLDESNFIAFNYLGVVELHKNNLDEALKLFKKSTQLNPKFSVGYANSIYTLGRLEKIDESQSVYDKTKELNLIDPSIEKSFGIVLFNSNKLDDALELFQNMVALDSLSWEGYLLILDCLKKQKKYTEAIEIIKKADKIIPDNPEIYLAWGDMLYLLEDYEKSMEKLKRLIELDPTNYLAYEKIGCLYSEKSQFEKAIESFDKSTEINQLNSFPFFYSALANLHLGDFERAHDGFDRSIGLYPTFSDAYFEYAEFLDILGLKEEALRLIANLIEIKPEERYNCYNYMGIFNQKLGLYDQAEVLFKKSIELNPSNDLAYLNMGNLLCSIGALEESENFYLKAIDLAPQNAKNHYYYGITLYELSRDIEAEKEFIESIKLDDSFWLPYHYYGLVLLNSDRFEEAIHKFSESIRLNPKSTLSFYYWSVALERLGKQDEANEKLQQAIFLNPEYENLLKKADAPWYLYG